jgi:hypothetical protein
MHLEFAKVESTSFFHLPHAKSTRLQISLVHKYIIPALPLKRPVVNHLRHL